MNIRTILYRYLALFVQVAFLITAVGCDTPPTADSTPYEVLPTMTTFPILAIPPVSIPLSGEWCFSIDKDQVGGGRGWANPNFDDSSWATVNVPHNWNVMPEHSEYEGIVWYRRIFTIPMESQNAHLRLRFKAVFYLAHVWVNGQYLGQHEGGYIPFEFDVTSIVKSGEKNVLAVQVDNLRATNRIPVVIRPDWSFDWWNYGGITRDVSLEITSRIYIARQKIVSIPHLSGLDEADAATVAGTITVNNTSSRALDGSIQVDLADDTNGQSVLTSPASAAFNVAAKNSVEVQMNVTIASPKLWHFDHPNLYRWSVSLLDDDGQVLHTKEVMIGIRSVELKDGYFYLNGEPVRLVGITRHADYPGQGSAEKVTATLIGWKLVVMKFILRRGYFRVSLFNNHAINPLFIQSIDANC